ncbi:hypothetical protein HZP13_14635 [Elizabethkingia anophelis]|nr:hypothetical protein [Elizabethkingia anophelis]
MATTKEKKVIDTENLQVTSKPVEGSVSSKDLIINKDDIVNNVISDDEAELSKQSLAKQMGNVSVKLTSIPEDQKEVSSMLEGQVYDLNRETIDFFQAHGFEFEVKK